MEIIIVFVIIFILSLIGMSFLQYSLKSKIFYKEDEDNKLENLLKVLCIVNICSLIITVILLILKYIV